ncbi:MAG: LysE family translocator [bacterium]
MIAFEIWLTYALAASIILLIPGPTILLVIAKSLTHGRRAAAPLVLGVMAGDAIALLLSLFGLGALVAASAQWFALLKWLGAAYLIWLGATLWRASPPLAVAEASSANDRSLLLHAFAVTALNPKGILFFIAFLPQFVDAGGDVPLQLGVLGVTFVVLGGVNALGYALCAGGFARLLACKSSARRMRRCGGLALIGAGVWAATAQRG